MNETIKNRIKLLINSLIFDNNSGLSEEEINLELDQICPDPQWSDYIFWSDDYINNDGSINFDKFFNKVYTSSIDWIENPTLSKDSEE